MSTGPDEAANESPTSEAEAAVAAETLLGEEAPPVVPTADPADEEPHCPTCGAHGVPGARFCEECGGLMDASAVPTASSEPATAEATAGPAARPCVRCGGVVADDGYCQECGAPAVSERDHFTATASAVVGGVCDRGVTHARNEDAMALEVVEGLTALVVCDGVSTAPASDVASMAAAQAALGVLVAGAPGGGREVTPVGPARTSAWASLLIEAAARADAAVLEVPTPQGAGDAPSCTFVAGVVEGDLVVVAGVGDSRAYWLPDGGAGQQLTTDDSWAQEMLEAGMPRAQVERSRHAHAITRWLGADAPELTPRTSSTTVTEPGWLMLCSDGLWNYCGDAVRLGELVRSTAAEVGSDATTLAAALVAWANAQGGRDNVTVVLARLGEPTH